MILNNKDIKMRKWHMILDKVILIS